MRSTNSLQIAPDDRWLLLVNPAHMGGINGVLRALLNGATLYLYSLLRNSLPALRDYLNEHVITVFHAVPTVYRLFVKSQAGRAEFPDLRMFLIGGEALFANDVKMFQTYFKAPCKLVNHLGCTEFSGYAEYVIDHTTTLDGGVVPVGFAAEGMEISIVDDYGRSVEQGQVGNIEICSEFLAMGYWQDPDLTQSRFRTVISNSIQKNIYQPGDIGKMSPDGCLIFLGREDSQVHIRGNRVELIEIEQALRKFPQIADARVVAYRRSNDELALTAYITLQVENNAKVNEIMRYLGRTLPDYMVPNDIVCIDEFPLNANGKIDYKMLQSEF
jgi:acyl-coenzyme A synthetase/AMP-(fatty) acid ligase